MNNLLIRADESRIVRVAFASDAVEAVENPIVAEARRQLAEYFAGTRREFELPVRVGGTPFQRQVWAELCRIPYGETITYGELARRIGRPTACRAVAAACGANPLCIVVPCHRVVASNGPGGFAAPLEVKLRLLELERQNSKAIR